MKIAVVCITWLQILIWSTSIVATSSFTLIFWSIKKSNSVFDILWTKNHGRFRLERSPTKVSTACGYDVPRNIRRCTYYATDGKSKRYHIGRQRRSFCFDTKWSFCCRAADPWSTCLERNHRPRAKPQLFWLLVVGWAWLQWRAKNGAAFHFPNNTLHAIFMRWWWFLTWRQHQGFWYQACLIYL